MSRIPLPQSARDSKLSGWLTIVGVCYVSVSEAEIRLEGLLQQIEQGQRSAAQVSAARALLKEVLRQIVAPGVALPNDVLQTFELPRTRTPESRAVALRLLRWIAIDGLVGDANDANAFSRRVVSFVEKELPEVAVELKLSAKRQTHEKFAAIKAVYTLIVAALEPFRHLPREINAFLAARPQMLKALNNFYVRAYGSGFDLPFIKNNVDGIFNQLAALNTPDTTFIDKLGQTRSAVENFQIYVRNNLTLFHRQTALPFVIAAKAVLDDIESRSRSRFLASIEPRFPDSGTLQKRYPLQEQERSIAVRVPLRNRGPGSAYGTTIVVEAEEEAIYLGSKEIYLGEVRPGDFSVAIECLIMEPMSSADLLVEINWNEGASAEQKSTSFVLKLVAQEKGIDWVSLEYERPYSTDVARGNAFVGRKERVIALATRLPHRVFLYYRAEASGKDLIGDRRCGFCKAK
jgi:hypothetical protein